MKKFLLPLVLISQIYCPVFAADDGGYPDNAQQADSGYVSADSFKFFDPVENFTGNLFLNYAFFEEVRDPTSRALISFFTSSLSFGFGWHLNIIPHFLAPGIYAEAGISFLDLVAEGIRGDDDELSSPWFGLAGIRLYNQFTYGKIALQPFAGITAIGEADADNPLGGGFKTFGILVAVSALGIEYSYGIPFSGKEGVHRIAVGLHIGGL